MQKNCLADILDRKWNTYTKINIRTQIHMQTDTHKLQENTTEKYIHTKTTDYTLYKGTSINKSEVYNSVKAMLLAVINISINQYNGTIPR